MWSPNDDSSPKKPDIVHVPVMLDEVLHYLAPRPGQIVVDGTVGAGGHAKEILRRIRPGGMLIGVDRDPGMLERAKSRLSGPDVVLVHGRFDELRQILDSLGIDRVDSVLLDLGIASDQLADRDRGFSFLSGGPLDMRMDPTRQHITAADIVNRASEKELVDLLRTYGEERMARRIARAIVQARRRAPIRTAEELAAVVRAAVPRNYEHGRIDPATRTFQALRIAVNEELDALQRFLEEAPRCLKPGGTLVIISFHSLEDRLVKRAFAARDVWERLTKKPVRPSEAEIRANPRARSARLRAARLRPEVCVRPPSE